jgi:catechol 2,3-dioxygenase-like lactoylglutathione lyase family enzyme
MSEKQKMDHFMASYLALAQTCKRENRMVFNHVCIRVEDIDAAEKLLCDSFGLESFLRPGGETFDSEKEFRVCWLQDNNMYLEMSEFDEPQTMGYDTGVGQPIGHLSEIGFFVPDMDRAMKRLEQQDWEITSAIDTDSARMYKINNTRTPGIPVELIDYGEDE